MFGACGADRAAEAGSFVVHDSAGIAIASNPADADRAGAASWRAVEVLRIGGLDGPPETLFHRPGQMVPDGEGGVFIVEAGESAIRRYGPDGAFRGRLGGPGEGPGEFQAPGALVRRGDTLLVFDSRLMRMTWFDANGGLAGTRPVAVDWMNQGIPSTLAPLGRGALASIAGAGCSLPAPDDRRPRIRLSVIGPPEEAGSPLAVEGPVTRWVDPSFVPIYGESFCSVLPALAGHRVPRAFRADGVAAVAPGPEYEVHVFRLPDDPTAPEAWTGGALGAFPAPARIIRRALPRHPVAPEERRGFEARMREIAEESNWVSYLHAAWDTLPAPAAYPAIQELHWDDAGNLWVQRWAPWHEDLPMRSARGAGPWDVFDAEGRWIAEVVLPDGVTVALIHEGRIWGIARDDFDVASLVAFEVER